MKKSIDSLLSKILMISSLVWLALLPLPARADIIGFDNSLSVTATPQPALNTLNFLRNTCEVMPGNLIVDVSILSTSYCDTGLFNYSGMTIANRAIHVGNMAASSSSQAHAYLMTANATPFTLNGVGLKSYATRTDMKISQWVVYAVKADGTTVSYQAPVIATGFTFTDMTNLVYAHIFSTRGAFDLYNLDITF